MTALPAAATVAGATLVALATVAGALGSRWSSRRPVASSVAVSLLLLAVVLGDLLPDVHADLAETGTPVWLAVLAAAVGFSAVGALVRRGCACAPGPDTTGTGSHADEVAGGTGTAVAIGLHRFLEGAALALVGSPALVAALVVHAAGEGFALGFLLERGSRRRVVTLLGLACLSPLVGASVLAQERLPATVAPVVAALVAGSLLRTALLALRVPAMRRRAGRPAALRSQPA